MRLILLVLFLISTLGLKQHKDNTKPVILNNFISMKDRVGELDNEYQIEYYIDVYSKKYNVPKDVIYAVAKIESGYGLHKDYNPFVVSSVGALGPMQVMLTTAQEIMDKPRLTKKELLYDIKLNVESGVKYLSIMYNTYNNWELTLISYNAGPVRANKIKFAYESGQQDEYLHLLPKETQNYIKKSRMILF